MKHVEVFVCCDCANFRRRRENVEHTKVSHGVSDRKYRIILQDAPEPGSHKRWLYDSPGGLVSYELVMRHGL